MMNIVVFLLSCLLSSSSLASSNISDLVEKAIIETDPNLNIGIKIMNLETGKTVYEKNSKRYFIPASSLKFISIISMLEYFGADYKFTSRILKKDDDYYIDIHHPNFSSKDLQLMLKKIAEDSGKIIKGNIYIASNEFSVPPLMREKLVSDTMYCNGALITKVHLNKNCAKIDVSPGKIGQNIIIKSNKDFPYIIENNARTVKKNALDRLHVDLDKNKYIINGTLSKSYGALPIGVVTDRNFDNIIYHAKKGLKAEGVQMKGKISVGKLPKDVSSIYTHSISYAEAASRAMKISNNFMTDYFLAEYATSHKVTEWRRAIINMKNFIYKKFGVDLEKSEIHDASGLSRRNLLTVSQISDFLSATYKSKNFPIIQEILAHPGDDCTLRDRFKGVDHLHTKTGTLRHVSALVGYFKNKKGQQYSFVIMANNFYPYNQPYRSLEEKLVRLFMEDDR